MSINERLAQLKNSAISAVSNVASKATTKVGHVFSNVASRVRRTYKSLKQSITKWFKNLNSKESEMESLQGNKARRAGYFTLFIILVTTYIGLDDAGEQILLLTCFTCIFLLFVLPLIPGFVNALANEPNQNRPAADLANCSDQIEVERALANVAPYSASTFGFFTFLAPGQVKSIIRGKRFIRFIMRFDGHTFLGYTQKGQAEKGLNEDRRRYYEVKKIDDKSVVDAEGNQADDAHPIPVSLRCGFYDLIWWWSRYVYRLTGAVFTGIPPFQTVETYELERLRKVIGIVGESNHESFILVRVKNFSDHVRAAEFQFFVEIPGAETQDQVKVRLQYALTVKVVNPYRAFYDTDLNWATRLTTAVTQEVSSVVRGFGYKHVIAKDSSENSTVQRNLIECVTNLNHKTRGRGVKRDAKRGVSDIGLFIKEAELLEVDVADTILANALADVARSKADAEARVNRGESEARAIEMVAESARRYGSYGELALRIEGQIRTVESANEGAILNIRTGDEAIDAKTALLEKSLEGDQS